MPTEMPDIREARFDDHAAIMELEASQGLNPRPFDDWSALWARNPVYKKIGGKWPIGWVMESADGRLTGCIGNIPSAYEWEGRELIAANGRAWAVAPEHRAFALALMGEFFAQPDADLFFNTTVNDQAVEAFTSCGSERAPVGDWNRAAYWVTSYRGFVESALRVKRAPMPRLLSLPGGVALRLKDLVSARGFPASALRVEEAAEFDERFDIFWQSLRKHKRRMLLGVRDRAALDWHYGLALAKARLWIVTIPSPSGIVAYGIFLRKDHAASGLTRMRLVDFQAIERGDDCLAAILRHAHERCGREGIHALEQVGCELPGTRLVDELAPYRRNLPAWPYYYLAVGPDAEAVRDAKVWEPSSFDGDSSL